MKIKTSELSDQALDWAVGTARGFKVFTDLSKYHRTTEAKALYIGDCRASTDAAQGGPILDQDNIATLRMMESFILPDAQQTRPGPVLWGSRLAAEWVAYQGDVALVQGELVAMHGPYAGPTRLIAGLRCFVASRLGDEVEVPDELVPGELLSARRSLHGEAGVPEKPLDTAWYISEMNMETMVGMATHGPFASRQEADDAVSDLVRRGVQLICPQITTGPPGLGPNWQENIQRWRAGVLQLAGDPEPSRREKPRGG